MRSRPSRAYPSRASDSFRVASRRTPVELHVVEPNWREAYGDNWRELADACKRRDGYECQKCGGYFPPPFRHKWLHAHHIIELSKGGPNILANLVTYCFKCHKEHHQGVS
jgi:hypothetical protein